MEKVLILFLSTNHWGENCLIYNKQIGKGDFSSLTDGGRKMFTDLTHILNTWKSTSKWKGKKAFSKQNHCGNCHPLFGNRSVLNSLKNFKSNFNSAHAAISSQATAEEEQVIDQKSSLGSVKQTLSTCLRPGNTIQFQKICFVYNRIRTIGWTSLLWIWKNCW